jgi:ribosomal protein L7/L12
VRHTLLGHCIAVPARLAVPLVEAHDHPITMGVPSPDRLDGDRHDEPVTVRLDGFDPRKKVSVIKALREITGLALLEARDMVEGAPRPVKEGIDRVEAEAIQKQLVDAGGKVSLV